MTGTYDLIIIGAGPAGMTAGIYAARSKLKTLVIGGVLGGTANSISYLENWPGFRGKGVDLMKRFYEQLNLYDIEVVLGEVQNVEKKGKGFSVKTLDKEFESKAVILATGIKRENLKIPGEEKFVGKGISYCATCDGFFYKDRGVAFVAREDCNPEEILALAKITRKVYVITTGKRMKCENEIKKFPEKGKIEIIPNSVVEEILGKEKVEGIKVKTGKGTKEIIVDGIFVGMGSLALTKFAKNLKLKLDKENNIIVDEQMKSSVPGVFAAGDVTNSKVRQVLTASSQGAVAAKSVNDWLKE
jgi:thioredoxin reductase (NADPH)